MTVSCKDCDSIPKVKDAGKILTKSGNQIQLMHNGLKMIAGGYCGDWMSNIIEQLSGHHEPQEELVFHHLISSCTDDSLFVELGAYWSYYSIWYLKSRLGSRAICIEPDLDNMKIGRQNADLNRVKNRITFVNGWCGASDDGYRTFPTENNVEAIRLPCYDYPKIEEELGARQVEVLHMDIQGAETDLINSLSNAKSLPRFLVISTHHMLISGHPNTHGICLQKLRTLGARILCEHSVEQSYSGDGLIIASFGKERDDPYLPQISRNISKNSLFGPPIFTSFSQNLEDVMLWRALKDIDKGFYIDVGAAWPDTDSVTKAFYDLQWHGINIEPDFEFYQLLRDQRPRDINIPNAIADKAGWLTLNRFDGTGLSTLNTKLAQEHEAAGYQSIADEIEVKTLKEIWSKFVPKDQDVHFLKIDVGGAEKLVVEGNDWQKNRPWIIVIKTFLPNTQIENHDKWEKMVLSANYLFAYQDGVNRFYVAEEHPELLPAFKYPPNVLDNFLRSDHQKSEARAVEAEARVTEAEAWVTEAEARATESQIRATEAEIRSSEGENRVAEAEARAVEAEAQYQEIINSRSWRLTAPMRSVTRSMRWFVRGCVAWFTLKPGSRPRRIARMSLTRLSNWVLLRPKIKVRVLSLLKHFPRIMAFLKRMHCKR